MNDKTSETQMLKTKMDYFMTALGLAIGVAALVETLQAQEPSTGQLTAPPKVTVTVLDEPEEGAPSAP
jgi:histidyl-tRNA synthetase